MLNTKQRQQSTLIKSLAEGLGFNYCGIAKAALLTDDAKRLEKWLAKGMHGNMQYMENHFDLRIDPTKLVPGAKSVITLLMNYFPERQQNEDIPKIAKYAYGQDYHEVIRDKMKQLIALMTERIGEINGRGFVDSAPVLERAWAVKSGLGWVGKNGNLINKQQGSFFFIATLITDLELEYDSPYVKDFCGTCTKCIDSCPTDAILPDKVIDGSKCISYFTIELKSLLIPDEMKGKFQDWIFGCDICQDVCPWNRFSTPTKETGFSPLPALFEMTADDWTALGEERFKSVFRHSPIKRAKYTGLLRNLRFAEQ